MRTPTVRLRATDDTENAVVDLRRWPQEKATMNGARGDFDESARRDEAKGSSHAGRVGQECRSGATTLAATHLRNGAFMNPR
jgi:hypothetical protein